MVFHRIEIKKNHLHCLRGRELLNDIIIDFHLLYIFNEKLSIQNKEKCFLVNTFAYQNFKKIGEINGQAVRQRNRFFCDTYLLTKDFIFVPFNEK